MRPVPEQPSSSWSLAVARSFFVTLGKNFQAQRGDHNAQQFSTNICSHSIIYQTKNTPEISKIPHPHSIMSSNAEPPLGLSSAASNPPNTYGRFVPLLDMSGARRDWHEDLSAPPTTPDRRIRVADLRRKIGRQRRMPARNFAFIEEVERADDADFLKPGDEMECICFTRSGGGHPPGGMMSGGKGDGQERGAGGQDSVVPGGGAPVGGRGGALGGGAMSDGNGKPIVLDEDVRYRMTVLGISRRLFKAKVPRSSRFTMSPFVNYGAVWELWEERMRAPRKGEKFDPNELVAHPERFDSFRLNLVHKRAWGNSDCLAVRDCPGVRDFEFVLPDLSEEDDGEEPDHEWDIPYYIGAHEGKGPNFQVELPHLNAGEASFREVYHSWAKRLAIRQAGRCVFLLKLRADDVVDGPRPVDELENDEDARRKDGDEGREAHDVASDSSDHEDDDYRIYRPHADKIFTRLQLRFDTVADATRLREALLEYPALVEDFSQGDRGCRCSIGEHLWAIDCSVEWPLFPLLDR